MKKQALQKIALLISNKDNNLALEAILDGANYQEHIILGYTSLRLGADSEAMQFFVKSIEKQPTPYAYAGLGICYTRQGDIEKAEKVFEMAHELDSRDYVNDIIKVNLGKKLKPEVKEVYQSQELIEGELELEKRYGFGWLYEDEEPYESQESEIETKVEEPKTDPSDDYIQKLSRKEKNDESDREAYNSEIETKSGLKQKIGFFSGIFTGIKEKIQDQEPSANNELKVLKYVSSQGGTISISTCSEELGLSKEEVKETLQILEQKGKLG